MFARAVVIAALLLLACDEQPLERLPAPVTEIKVEAPPPPPPPPPMSDEAGNEIGPPEPPPELDAVLAPQPEPPVIMFFELTDDAAADAFLGYGIAQRKKLETADAKELLLRLAEPDGYVDGGSYECLEEPLGVHIVHGDVTRDVVVDCAHMYFTRSRRDGRFVLLAPALATYIDSLR